MPVQLKDLKNLIDVVALSKNLCTSPIKALLAYATKNNFLGRYVNGYTPGVTDFALMTKDAALALCAVQNELLAKHQFGLLILDSYRPRKAVLDFIDWSTQPVSNTQDGKHELAMKQKHYPRIEKNRLFDLGYVSANSEHCFGHTVDLILIDINGDEKDLGACFDFMDTLSHDTITANDIGEIPFLNRTILSKTMQSHGFQSYKFEFWHYSYKNKMLSKPIDITITADLKNLHA